MPKGQAKPDTQKDIDESMKRSGVDKVVAELARFIEERKNSRKPAK